MTFPCHGPQHERPDRPLSKGGKGGERVSSSSDPCSDCEHPKTDRQTVEELFPREIVEILRRPPKPTHNSTETIQ